MAVTIYTTSSCHACKEAKSFFHAKGVEFEEVNVENDRDMQQELAEMSGQLAVPVIDINGKLVIGFDKRRLVELLGF
jgi:glutaredoxin-like YruB-family protein